MIIRYGSAELAPARSPDCGNQAITCGKIIYYADVRYKFNSPALKDDYSGPRGGLCVRPTWYPAWNLLQASRLFMSAWIRRCSVRWEMPSWWAAASSVGPAAIGVAEQGYSGRRAIRLSSPLLASTPRMARTRRTGMFSSAASWLAVSPGRRSSTAYTEASARPSPTAANTRSASASNRAGRTGSAMGRGVSRLGRLRSTDVRGGVDASCPV